MTAIQQAKQKQTTKLILEEDDVQAFTVIPGTNTVVAAKKTVETLFIDEAFTVQRKPHDSVKDDDPITLCALEALSPDTLLGANYDSARQYTIEGDRLRETHAWDLLSTSSTSNAVSIATDKMGQIKAAVAYDYLHLLHDDGSTTFLHEQENGFWGLTCSFDGRYLANGRTDGTVELRNPADLSVVTTLTGLSACVLKLAFSPDGKYLAASDDYAKLLVWNVDTGEATEIPGWSKIIAIFWFSDSSGFVSVSLSRLINFHDMAELDEEPSFLGLDEYSPNYIQHAILRDDNTLLAFVEKNGIVRIHFD